ncbi:dnaJ homolog subfamily C member 11 [Phlebotomus argentipes]|uniref:dnaJ homolog subfamily C member 11 n=1 Tax=Phlebotomus argentipes TaxID=94469 RepID=UPI002892DCEB|nr:dnaJ homolog subfamily C member 11 [Phlebotomus argentipes]
MDDDYDEELGATMEEDYYTFLNVPRNATTEQINTAYRHLSRIYHPDKHVADVRKKIEAEALFNRLKTAYEVLSDPHKRAIYDSLGVKGLETDGWEVTLRQKTPAEIREEYERLAKEREERALQQKTNPRGNVTVMVNATEILCPYYDEFDEKLLPTVEVTGISMSQQIDAPLTVRDTVTLAGSLSAQKGIGNGAVSVTGRRLLNKGWVAVDVSAGNGPSVGVKGSRTLSQKVFANFGGSLNLRSGAIVPTFMSSLACQLSKHTVGYLTYNLSGMTRSMSTTVEQNTEKHHFQVTLLVGIPHSYISAAYTRKLQEQELKLRVATKLGTFGVLAEYGAEKKISKYSSVVATVSVGVPTGVTLKLKFTRSTQTFIFPIHLSEEIIPAAVFYATVTPLCVFFVLKRLVIEPMNDEKRQRRIDKTKEVNRERMAAKKKEAESSIDLMSATFERIRDDETKTHGLIIDRATYGRVRAENEERFDVTVPLQCLVKSGQLKLHATPKSELPGFYDPCVGEEKTLRIRCTYRETSHSIEISDNESLQLPGTLLAN